MVIEQGEKNQTLEVRSDGGGNGFKRQSDGVRRSSPGFIRGSGEGGEPKGGLTLERGAV